VPEVTGERCGAACETVKVTVPVFTVPEVLVTVVDKVHILIAGAERCCSIRPSRGGSASTHGEGMRVVGAVARFGGCRCKPPMIVRFQMLYCRGARMWRWPHRK